MAFVHICTQTVQNIYDTMQYIYVHSKADEMVSLI